jgi:hypothetical protein
MRMRALASLLMGYLSKIRKDALRRIWWFLSGHICLFYKQQLSLRLTAKAVPTNSFLICVSLCLSAAGKTAGCKREIYSSSCGVV